MFDARAKTAFTGSAPLVIERSPSRPIAERLIGKTPAEAAETLPRLFTHCRLAQSLAGRIALGQGDVLADRKELSREILRDHLMKFHVAWPGHFGFPPQPLPEGWAEGGQQLAETLFGASAAPPATPDEFDDFLGSDLHVAGVLRRIDQSFEPGEATSAELPSLTSVSAFGADPVENSVAGRHLLHPVMRHIAETRGRGPLWRAVARLYDTAAVLSDRLPIPFAPNAGQALVPSACGTYAISAEVKSGVITAFSRVTPTDHMTVDGGVLETALETLPATKAALAPLLLDILDPCSPVRLRQVRDA